VRLIIDTNILISALLSSTSLPAHLVVLWREGRFDLLTSADQLDELMRVTRYPKIRERLAPGPRGDSERLTRGYRLPRSKRQLPAWNRPGRCGRLPVDRGQAGPSWSETI
jgi:hypothetical protein